MVDCWCRGAVCPFDFQEHLRLFAGCDQKINFATVFVACIIELSISAEAILRKDVPKHTHRIRDLH
jgi:hypothetical protein